LVDGFSSARQLSGFNRGVIMEKFEKVLGDIGGMFCYVLMLMVVLQVLGRYFLKMEILPGSYNMMESYVFPLIVFLTMGRSFRDGLFPKFDLLRSSLPTKPKRVADSFALTVELIVYIITFVFTTIYAIKMVQVRRQLQAGANLYPLYHILWLSPFCFGLLSIETILIWLKVVIKGEEIS
jgi:TRAP-type C4-dicarboxylate transport system permease small subunit